MRTRLRAFLTSCEYRTPLHRVGQPVGAERCSGAGLFLVPLSARRAPRAPRCKSDSRNSDSGRVQPTRHNERSRKEGKQEQRHGCQQEEVCLVEEFRLACARSSCLKYVQSENTLGPEPSVSPKLACFFVSNIHLHCLNRFIQGVCCQRVCNITELLWDAYRAAQGSACRGLSLASFLAECFGGRTARGRRLFAVTYVRFRRGERKDYLSSHRRNLEIFNLLTLKLPLHLIISCVSYVCMYVYSTWRAFSDALLLRTTPVLRWGDFANTPSTHLFGGVIMRTDTIVYAAVNTHMAQIYQIAVG